MPAYHKYKYLLFTIRYSLFPIRHSLFIFCFSFLVFNLFCWLPPEAVAAQSSDDNWNLQINDITINSGLTHNQKTKPQEVKPTAIPQNEQIDTYDNLTFTFGISNYFVDFGILSATNPVFRTSNLSLSNAPHGSIITALENTPLLNKNTPDTIPDTTCDTGFCTEIRTDLWENTLTYGFGYRCDNTTGNGCPAEFKAPNYYKQFPDFSQNETAQIVMSANSTLPDQEVQITYKLNIGKTQPLGNYANTITYIASPGY